MSKDPLHGITLKMMLTELQQDLDWSGLAARIDIKCFSQNPSIKSSLTFLRRTPWAREKVEKLYIRHKGLRAKQPTKAKPEREHDRFADSQAAKRQGSSDSKGGAAAESNVWLAGNPWLKQKD